MKQPISEAPRTEEELLAEVKELLSTSSREEPYITNTALRIIWACKKYTMAHPSSQEDNPHE